MPGGLFAVRQVTSRYEYAYNANGQVAYVRNNLLGQIAQSEYDLSNRPCRVTTHKFTEDEAGNLTSLEHVYTGEVAYDDTFGRLSEFNEKVGADREEFVTTFGYDDENRPTALTYGDHGASTLAYDGLGRVAQATVTAGDGTANTTTYTYVAGAALEDEPDKTSTTGLVASIAQTGGNFTYTYDDNGNIASVVQDGVTTAYTYDALGQLVQVDDGQENCTWAYEYDQGGNIKSKKKYVDGVETESKVFTYGNADWRDQLTAVDGVAITYDAIGNPLNDGTWTYSWENGRQLARMQSVDIDASFVYNESGLRVQKTVNEVVTKYTLHGKNIVHMTQGGNELHFFYDAQNKPAVVVYNGIPYSYVKNLQDDIVAILDSNKNVVISYAYDAWGRPISCSGTMSTTLGKMNPFRYRGYVYDEETEFYYLETRYYNPRYGRFCSADSVIAVEALLGQNQYLYAKNSPIMYSDADGRFWKKLGSALAGVATAVASAVVATAVAGTKLAMSATPLGLAVTAAAGAIAGIGSEVAHSFFTGEKINLLDIISAGASGAVCALIPGFTFAGVFKRSFASSAIDALLRIGADSVSDDKQYDYDYSLEDFAWDVGVGMVGDAVGCFVGDKLSTWIADSTCDNLQPRHYRQMAALRGQQMSRRVAKQLARQGRALKRYVKDLSEQLYGVYHDMVWD